MTLRPRPRSPGAREGVTAIALASLLLASRSRAHALDTNTARVSLRDEHLEVSAEWDVFAAADATPTAIATATPEFAAEVHERLRRTLEGGTWLDVDGRRSALAITAFPGVDELRARAASLSSQGLEHGALVRLRFEAPARLPGALRVQARFPPEIGPVLTTFVQPSTVFVPPGAVARFAVLAPRGPSAQARPAVRPSFAWAVGAAAALALAIATRLFQMRKSS
jgi:hypothetical protein